MVNDTALAACEVMVRCPGTAGCQLPVLPYFAPMQPPGESASGPPIALRNSQGGYIPAGSDLGSASSAEGHIRIGVVPAAGAGLSADLRTGPAVAIRLDMNVQ
jgi:hypothetical protein